MKKEADYIQMMNDSFGIVILAAGASNRLGKPKQLLSFEGTTLLNHSISIAEQTDAGKMVVVIGANEITVAESITSKKVKVLQNADWEEGMASSIRNGLQHLITKTPTLNAVLILVCDQPFVSVELLQNLIKEYKQTGKPIIACSYNNTLGTPALFDKSIFEKLLALDGDIGAKNIMKDNPGLVHEVIFPKGNIDIDNSADYERLLQQKI